MELKMETGLWILLTIFLHILVLLFLMKKPKKSIKGKHVLVTGGSSGIGLHTAIICAKMGAHVTIVARNLVRLEKAKQMVLENRQNDQQKVLCKSIDLTKDYKIISEKLKEIEDEMGDIYMLANVAGMAICGTVEDVSIEDAKLMMDINYFSTYFPTRYVLPKMKRAKDGIIVITASQAALLGIYGYGAYAASKFALRGLAETLAMETKHKNINITLGLPADTDTPGFENEEKSKPEVTKLISGSGGLFKPEEIAKELVDDALAGNFFSIKGFESWILTILCVGMSPWTGPFLNIIQVLLLGPLRAMSFLLQWNFSRIVKSNEKTKTE